MIKDNLLFLRHILKSIGKVESFLGAISKPSFLADELLNNAVVRQIEVIGEAVKNLPNSFKAKYSNIPWKEIVGTRDKMIHHYFGVDLNIVWDIVKRDLPKLRKEVEEILRKEDTQR